VVLLGAIASAALALVMITVYLLAYQHVSERREAVLAERRRHWVVRWLEVLYRSEPPPAAPLGRDALGALLDVRETVRGTEADRVTELLTRYGVGPALERGARSGRVSSRLESLDGLARARMPDAIATLVAAMADPERAIRVAAARAAARTLAGIEEPSARRAAARAVVEALERRSLPFGVVEEMLLLADEGAPSLIDELLLYEHAPIPSLRAALDAVGRLQLLEFAEETVRFLDHTDPELRAAALRALARTGLLPPAAHASVLVALEDEVEFVRIHATSAARLLPRDRALVALWERLGDPSWWVRGSAAEALAALGPAGLAELGRAADTHPDRYARDMAAQALRDRTSVLVEAVAG
jgi:HEAT repeat protein